MTFTTQLVITCGCLAFLGLSISKDAKDTPWWHFTRRRNRRRTGPGCAGSRFCCLQVYEHTDCGGPKGEFPVGEWGEASFTAKGARNDKISSVRFDPASPDECEAKLYDNGNFNINQGRRRHRRRGFVDTYTREAHGANCVNIDHSDQTSSIKVYYGASQLAQSDTKSAAVQGLESQADALKEGDRSSKAATRVELQAIKVSKLRKWAIAAGANQESMDAADDADDIKHALIELILLEEKSALSKKKLVRREKADASQQVISINADANFHDQ